MKGAFLTIGGLLVAAGIFAGMVLYTVSLMRQCELQILTGNLPPISIGSTEETK